MVFIMQMNPKKKCFSLLTLSIKFKIQSHNLTFLKNFHFACIAMFFLFREFMDFFLSLYLNNNIIIHKKKKNQQDVIEVCGHSTTKPRSSSNVYIFFHHIYKYKCREKKRREFK